ncbi:hypothetical protein WG906_05790 [Pedobacter sp. P351]|uniref:hypothetical protein n=1 Tax=Pedobacter superstes TaxID=3133441 RepID=UPI0030AE60BB
MKTFKYQLVNDPRLFEVCQDIEGKNELYSIFEVHLSGSHYEYLYRNNSSGEYTSTPASRLSSKEIAQLGERVEIELHKETS